MGFLVTGFFAAFLEAGFLDFLAAGFLAAGFFAAGFLVADFWGTSLICFRHVANLLYLRSMKQKRTFECYQHKFI